MKNKSLSANACAKSNTRLPVNHKSIGKKSKPNLPKKAPKELNKSAQKVVAPSLFPRISSNSLLIHNAIQKTQPPKRFIRKWKWFHSPPSPPPLPPTIPLKLSLPDTKLFTDRRRRRIGMNILQENCPCHGNSTRKHLYKRRKKKIVQIVEVQVKTLFAK